MAGQNIQQRSTQELVIIHNTSKCKPSVNNPGSKILVIKYAIKITCKLSWIKYKGMLDPIIIS